MNFEELRRRAQEEWQVFQSGPHPRILVGTATCGRAAGAEEVKAAFMAELASQKVEAQITDVGCLGLCYIEPMVGVMKPGNPQVWYGNVTPKLVPELVRDYVAGNNPRPDLALGSIGEGSLDSLPRLFDLPMLKPQARVVLKNCGLIDPENLNHYLANGGYTGLAHALTMTPEAVIEEIKKSGLRGRGGAGFPTGQKWEFCRQARGEPKYIICNADEGDPGAFMNRSLLESDPHSVLEGMVIGGYAIGAGEGYIYCREEYPLAIERLKIAMRQMEAVGFLGDNILGSGFSFRLKLREGAGAFVCGEETALMASVEGRRGMPRPRPPFPAQAGVWAKPTNINNVETWAQAAIILQKGADWWSGYGVEKNRGTKTFCLTGKVKRTGLIEVPLGMTIRQVLFEVGGGIVNDKAFKGVQSGGPSGGCLATECLDLSVDYESLTEAGAIMGSGGLVVADEDTCMVDMARFFQSFTQRESCGKCVPCRVGTRQSLEILERITQGEGRPEDMGTLQTLGQTIKASALCGLGQTAPHPVLSTLRYFRKEYEAHIFEKRCPAVVCKALIRYFVVPEKCQGCLICLRACPVQCIAGDRRLIHVIDQPRCIKCSSCYQVCPFDAVTKLSGSTLPVPEKPIPIVAPPPKKPARR